MGLGAVGWYRVVFDLVCKSESRGLMNREEHLLSIVAEECAEVAHSVSKAMRFGMVEVEPGQTETNASRIQSEYCDLMAAMQMLGECDKEIYKGWDTTRLEKHLKDKKAKVEKFLKYSAMRGTLAE